MRGGGPKIEFLPRASALLTDEKRAAAREALNACTRELLDDNDRLAITFGALKNQTARDTVFTLMDDLLQTT